MKTITVSTPTLDKNNDSFLAKIVPSMNYKDKLFQAGMASRSLYIHREHSVESSRAVTHCAKVAISHDENAHFVIDMSSDNNNWFDLAAAMQHNETARELLAFNHYACSSDSVCHKTSVISGVPIGRLIPKAGLSEEVVSWLNSCAAPYKGFFDDLFMFSGLDKIESHDVFSRVSGLFSEGIMSIHNDTTSASWGDILKSGVTMNYVRLPCVLGNPISRNFIAEFYINLIEYLVNDYQLNVGVSILGFSNLAPDLLDRIIGNPKISTITLTDIEGRSKIDNLEPYEGWNMYLGRVNNLNFFNDPESIEVGLGSKLDNGIYLLPKTEDKTNITKDSFEKVRDSQLPSYYDEKCVITIKTPEDAVT
ncbi:hypothetical protein LMH73_027010 [Vibrio splendidus]|nr:hypothetical protein [Vibrio splendidus]MCC4880300.1 hypothetical protein [Vibrio splendidus]